MLGTHRKGLFAALVALVVGSLGIAATPVAAGSAPSIAVAGNQLVDGGGKPIRLLGMNRSGAEYACAQGWGIFDGPTDDASVSVMASWKINAVRVPLNEDCWLGINGVKAAYAGANYQNAIKSYVTTLHNAGLVAVLDLHWNAPGSTLATSQQDMADADHSPAFWSSVANAFKGDPGVAFDLYNEPRTISWSCWRDGCTTAGGWRAAGMQSLVNAVRSTGAGNVVLVGGISWASDLSQWLTWRPTDSANQLAAAAHLYNFSGCNTSTCWTSTIAPVAKVAPVITGELGEDDCAHGYIDKYMGWADTNGVSYMAWAWDAWPNACGTGPTLISDYSGTPTNYGAGYKAHLSSL